MTRRPLSHEVLPPPGYGVGDRPLDRWTASKKLAVVRAVGAGQISLPQALVDHGLSTEEYLAWQADAAAAGPIGLRVGAVRDRARRRGVAA